MNATILVQKNSRRARHVVPVQLNRFHDVSCTVVRKCREQRNSLRFYLKVDQRATLLDEANRFNLNAVEISAGALAPGRIARAAVLETRRQV